METIATMLAFDAVKRDLGRYTDSVNEPERQRIMARMIDTIVDVAQVDQAEATMIVAGMIEEQS